MTYDTITHLGQILNEPFDEYLSKKQYISASDIKKFRISPKHYKLSLEEKEDEEEKKNLIIGSAIHAFILEPDQFYERYVCLKNDMLPRATSTGIKNYTLKENREFRDNFQNYHPKKKILGEQDYDLIVSVCSEAIKHETIKALFKSGHSEVSMYAIDEKTKLMKKGRADRIPDFGSCIIDAKSCMDSSPKSFSYDVFKFGYHNQAAHYLDLFDKKEFIFIALEKKVPYVPQVYNLDQAVINQARDENRMYMDMICWSFERNYWCDYNEFEILKMIYRDNCLYERDIDVTLTTLDDFFEIKNKNKGINTIFLPIYYK